MAGQILFLLIIILAVVALLALKGRLFEIKRKNRRDYYRDVYLKSEEWQRKRYVVLRRDNWRCVYCGGCKCWANHKTIHEKHINQLYGTVVKYYIEHKQILDKRKSLILFPDLISSGQIKATFVTTTKLSDTAKKFADALGVKVIQNKQLEQYPVIKCNISSNGSKIYHLPFDQQYDKTLIKNHGEFYAQTVIEAENKRFRRAFKWLGTN